MVVTARGSYFRPACQPSQAGRLLPDTARKRFSVFVLRNLSQSFVGLPGRACTKHAHAICVCKIGKAP